MNTQPRKSLCFALRRPPGHCHLQDSLQVSASSREFDLMD